jgi:glutathione S-transferase
MILIGMFDSPFVRRVAVSMKLLGLSFEHYNWSVGKDFDRIRQYNPVGRVPALVLDDGEALIESAAILDYLDELAGDELAGPGRALLPRAGAERRDALRIMALTSGAAEKGVAQLFEYVFRPEDKRHEPWIARCRTQMQGALAELERICQARGPGKWLVADRLTQADITVTCIFTYLTDALALTPERAPYPAIRALAARCEALPEFQATRLAFVAPIPAK